MGRPFNYHNEVRFRSKTLQNNCPPEMFEKFHYDRDINMVHKKTGRKLQIFAFMWHKSTKKKKRFIFIDRKGDYYITKNNEKSFGVVDMEVALKPFRRKKPKSTRKDDMLGKAEPESTMPAKRPGICPYCWTPIKMGQMIAKWQNKWGHLNCIKSESY